MADTKTPFYQLTNPEVGGSSDSWGTKENDDRTLVDEIMAIPRPAIAVSTTGELDLAEGVVQQITVDGDKNITITNTPEAEVDGEAVSTLVWLLIINGGAHTVDWSGVSVAWLSGAEPTLRASGVDVILLITGDEGTNWQGAHIDTLNDLAVTTAKINDLAVTTGKLAADAVTNAKLADNAVQNENILDGTIAQAKLGFSVQTSPELPVHVSQAFYDGSNAAVQGILDVLSTVGLIEVS